MKKLIEAESDLAILEQVRVLLTNQNATGSVLEEKLVSRALKSKEDIRAKRVSSREEVEIRIAHLWQN